jgi:hypothetical protein
VHGACGVIDTACTIRTALAAFIYLSQTYMFPNCPTPTLKIYINLTGLPNKKNFALENRSYLGEFDAEFKKALARESGTKGKKPRVENLVPLSL